MKLALIENWRSAWRMLSVQLATLLALVATAYEHLPIMQAYMPEGWVKWAALLVVVARIIQQPKLHADV